MRFSIQVIGKEKIIARTKLIRPMITPSVMTDLMITRSTAPMARMTPISTCALKHVHTHRASQTNAAHHSGKQSHDQQECDQDIQALRSCLHRT